MRTLPVSTVPIPSALPGFSRLVSLGAAVLDRIDAAWTVRRERNALLSLDDRMLSDVGLSRTDAEREAGRGLFDLCERRFDL